MSDTATSSGDLQVGSTRNSVLVLIAVATVAAIAWFIYSQPPRVERSVIGLNGFAYFAKGQGLDIKPFKGETRLQARDFGLRILPLYDNDLIKGSSKEERNNDSAQEVRRMTQFVFRRKTASISTLVVLPKWRAGILEYEKLHPKLLINTNELRFPNISSLGIGAPTVHQGQPELETVVLKRESSEPSAGMADTAQVRLYAPQSIRLETKVKQNCTPIYTSGDDVYVARCVQRGGGRSFWVISDPDIINNHGAVNGDNAAFALQLVKALSNGKPVIVDNTTKLYLTKVAKTEERDRSFADLARFFNYPFSYLWIGFLILSFFTLWHAWRRYGAVITGDEENQMHGSKAVAIEANVQILRAAGNDAPLTARYVRQRLDTLSSNLLGAHRKLGVEGEEQVLAVIRRRFPKLADRLENARSSLSSGTLERGGNVAALKEFELTLQEIAHEFGRPTKARL